MLRRSDISSIAVLGLLAAALLSSRAAVPVTPELQRLSEEDRIRQVQFDAQASLREKIQVGTQRYEERQAFRQALVKGMREQVEARQDEISGNTLTNLGDPKKTGFDSTHIILTVLVLVAGFLAMRYFQKHQSEAPLAH